MNMKDYLKMHANQVSYDTWKTSDSYVTLNVSLIEDTDSITYNPAMGYAVITPARYLTFRAGSDNSSVGLRSNAAGHNVYYSKDLRYWKPFNTSVNIKINNGEKVYVIGDSDNVTSFEDEQTTFRMTGSISVTGDITGILDYKTLDEKIAPNCYRCMFMDCTALTQAPELPATTLANYCYRFMFRGCTSLTQAPALPATILAQSCYGGMFYGCTALTKAPALPALTLADNCYSVMFRNCTALTQAPELPATTLAYDCYYQMFYGCTSLTHAPALPATKLATECYYQMFYNCVALTQAPTLPATRLESNNCYNGMFKNCTNLSSITCLATYITPNSTYDWLYRVAVTGTFTKSASMTSWSSGSAGIPNGWTVVDYTA